MIATTIEERHKSYLIQRSKASYNNLSGFSNKCHTWVIGLAGSTSSSAKGYVNSHTIVALYKIICYPRWIFLLDHGLVSLRYVLASISIEIYIYLNYIFNGLLVHELSLLCCIFVALYYDQTTQAIMSLNEARHTWGFQTRLVVSNCIHHHHKQMLNIIRQKHHSAHWRVANQEMINLKPSLL